MRVRGTELAVSAVSLWETATTKEVGREEFSVGPRLLR